MRALLIAGGSIDIRWAGEFVKLHRYDKIIAVDGGLSAANLLGLRPDMIVGDFDTVDRDLLAKYEADGKVSVTRLNPVKDDTDTQYAVKELIAMSVKEIHIIGGLGARMDHSLANIYMLKMAQDHGVKATMYDKINKISVIKGKSLLQKDEHYGKYISFVQLEEPARDVTLSGFKYNVEHFDFDTEKDKAYRMAVSNEFADAEATVNIGDGMFVVIEVNE